MTIGKISVGNVWDKRKEGVTYVYIGRKSKSLPRSPLANPYFITETDTRDMVCDMYEDYLQECLARDSEVRAELNRIGDLLLTGHDVVLTCYCKGRGKPEDIKRCHGDTLVNLINQALKDY